MNRHMLHPLRSRHNPYNRAARFIWRTLIIALCIVLVRVVLALASDAQAATDDRETLLACLNGTPMVIQGEATHCMTYTMIAP